MDKQQNLNLVRNLFEEVYNKGNFSSLDQFFSNDLKIFDTGGTKFKTGIAAFKEKETMYKNAFPNKNFKIDDIFATDDKVTVLWTCQGNQKGPLQDIPPTGKSINISGCNIFTIKDNKISEIRTFWDRLSLLDQLDEVELKHSTAH